MVLNVGFSFLSILCCSALVGLVIHNILLRDSILESSTDIVVGLLFTGLAIYLATDAFIQIRKYFREDEPCDS